MLVLDTSPHPPAPRHAYYCTQEFGHLDVLVNNAAQQTVCDDITKMDPATIERTFRTNVRTCRTEGPSSSVPDSTMPYNA